MTAAWAMPSGCGASSLGDRCGLPSTGDECVQLTPTAHATGHAVDHDQSHAAASPSEIVAEASGGHDGSAGQIELGKPASAEFLPVVIVESGTAQGAARHPQ